MLPEIDLDIPEHGGKKERDIVVAIEHTEAGLHAVQWVLDNIYRDGDVIHVIHVAKIKAPTTEIYHGPVGSSMRYRDLSLKDVHAEIEEIRAWLANEVVPLLKQKDAPYNLHLFVDKINATSHDVAKTICDTANSVGGALLVLSKSNKTRIDRFFVGSVVTALSKMHTIPTTFVQ